MTTETQCHWIVLPNGIVNDKARLSVFVTPKLIGEPGEILTLLDFPDMLDWPDLIETVEFKLFWRKDETSAVVPVEGGVAYSPVNRGERGLNSQVWNHLFKTRTIPVDPELLSSMKASMAERNSIVAVTYRAAIINLMVTETQLYHTMNAVLNVGEEPFSPESEDKQEFDRLVYLASGEAEVQLQKQSFAKKGEDDEFLYDPASTLSSFFGEVSLDGSIEELTGDDRSLNNHYRAFTLYHRHGIRNKNYSIRRPIDEPQKYPDFNFHDADQYQIRVDQNNFFLEFSENIPVVLPPISDIPTGYEIRIFFAPDESIESILDAEEVQRRVQRVGINESGGFNYEPMVIHSSESESFVGGASSLTLNAFRGVKLIRSSVGEWLNQPLEQQEFHSIISGLGSYPILLRQLGLVFDLEVDANILPGEKEKFQLLVEPVFPTSAKVDQRPNFSAHVGWSGCKTGEYSTVTANGVNFRSFCMMSEQNEDPTSFGGFQVMNPNQLGIFGAVGYSLQDTDAAIHKIVDKAIADGASPDPASIDDRLNPYESERRVFTPGSPISATGDPNAVDVEGEFRQPASRSTGITIILDQDGSRTIDRFRRTLHSPAQLETAIGERIVWPEDYSTAPVSFRDDVTVGWKVDVYISGPDVPEDMRKWYSLNDRQLKLNFLDNPELGQYLAISDAGWVEQGGTSEIDEIGNHQLRVSDYNFRIDQWGSLSSRHPSKAAPELGDGGEVWQRSISLIVDAEASAYSLAKLRYGRAIYIRATLTDLAGNGVHFDFANAAMPTPEGPLAQAVVSEPIVYRRLDPISPPVIYALQPKGPGMKVSESKANQGGQSGATVGPDQSDILVIRSGNAVPSSLGSGEWLVLPPDTDFQEVEAAGMLDGFSDPNIAYELLEKYSGHLPEGYDPNFLSTIRWPSGELGTPYLPDGYAAGATFCYLPGAEREPLFGFFSDRANAVFKRSISLSFDLKSKISNVRSPFSRPFRLRLLSGDRANRVIGRNLVVNLPPGEQQLIKVSCFPDPARLDHFELAHKTLDPGGTFHVQARGVELTKALIDNFSEAKATFLGGHIYQISPSKLVRLIHAVPKPIMKPAFSSDLEVINRVTSGNAVVVQDRMLALHRVSTGKIDIFVEWDDYLDIPGTQEFPIKRRERRHCFACDVPLPDCTISPDESHRIFDVGGRHSFPTNKHLQVNYIARATTRYKEYFGADIVDDFENIIEDSEPSCNLQILNTSPPPKPEVVYILPSFLWAEVSDDKQSKTTTTRRAGFTVFMKRGWFGSGRDERLAIVMQSKVEGAANSDPDLAPVPVTEWGSDPTIHDKNLIKRQPALEDCMSAVELVKACAAPMDFDPADPPIPSPNITKCGVFDAHCLVSARDGVHLPAPILATEVDSESLEAGPDKPLAKSREPDTYGADLPPEDEQRVDIAAYDVECDFNKDLLYAHVELKSPGAYMPFVRFAFARYQKNSAKYCALSSITYVDYVQLAPDRTVTVSRSADSTVVPHLVTVVGPGRGEEAIGYRTNVLRVYRLLRNNVREQYPLEVKGQWLPATESAIAIFQWQFQLSGPPGINYIVEEYEIAQDGIERLVFSAEITS